MYPETLYYTIVAFSLCSLYFSTLLINLNTREFVQGNGSVVTTMTSFASALRGRSDNDTIVLAPMHKRGGSGREVDVQVCSSRIPETQILIMNIVTDQHTDVHEARWARYVRTEQL